MTETLLSVGIDIGTSTTQLVISRLTLRNRAAPFAVPDVQIAEKEVLYRSGIHFTPLRSDTVIDTEGVRRIVETEYAKSGVEKAAIRTGAVIITGETARKENAREVLRELAGFAGDFVVATAGPELESLLAGAGAGAEAYSRQTGEIVLHFDIGGGTSNLVLYDHGEAVATGCLNVGGRLVKTEGGRIVYCSPVLKGLWAPRDGMEALIRLLVQALEDGAGLGDPDRIPAALRTVPLMKLPPHIDRFSFSGGVADLIDPPAPLPDDAYGDIGVLLGRGIRASRLWKHPRIPAGETIRATVVGAGSHSTRLSGSTITYANARFPYRNLPVLGLEPREEALPPAELGARIAEKRRLHGSDAAVLALTGRSDPHFADIARLAEGLSLAYGPEEPMLLAVEQDMAKALGQALLAKHPRRELVCLDGVRLRTGTYLDIGHPVADGSALPVVLKTLIFDG